MVGFLYRVSRMQTAIASQAELVERGLLPLVERGFAARALDDGSCIVAHGSTDPTRMVVVPDRQTWLPWGDGIDVGWWNDARPGPAVLGRSTLPAGWPLEPVTLQDGCTWHVPVLRGADGAERLPVVMAWQHGHWEAEVMPRFVRLHRLLGRAYVDLLRQIGVLGDWTGHVALDLPEQCEIAREALGLVYRVGEVELSALEVLTPGVLGEVLTAVLDGERLVQRLADEASQLAAGVDP